MTRVPINLDRIKFSQRKTSQFRELVLWTKRLYCTIGLNVREDFLIGEHTAEKVSLRFKKLRTTIFQSTDSVDFQCPHQRDLDSAFFPYAGDTKRRLKERGDSLVCLLRGSCLSNASVKRQCFLNATIS